MMILHDACRWMVRSAQSLLVLAFATAAWAQPVPDFDQARAASAARSACAPFQGRKLSLVVPNKPGGGFDLMARTFGPVLEQHSRMSVAVSNVPGAQGMMAIRAVSEARSDRPVIGLIGLGSFVNQEVSQGAATDWAGFTSLGLLSTDYVVWLTRQSTNWLQSGAKSWVVTSAISPFVNFGLPGRVLGLDLKPVFGYEGTHEAWLALLRGDIDATSISDQSAKRALATGSPAAVSLTLTSAPHPDFPGVPHLAGRGGLVDQRTRDMAPARRKELMAQAALAVTLSEQARMLLASTRLAPPLLACLRQASEAAMFDPALAEAARRQKLVLEPEPADKARAKMADFRQALDQNRPFLHSVVKEWNGGR